jgi:hypothetical protein
MNSNNSDNCGRKRNRSEEDDDGREEESGFGEGGGLPLYSIQHLLQQYQTHQKQPDSSSRGMLCIMCCYAVLRYAALRCVALRCVALR